VRTAHPVSLEAAPDGRLPNEAETQRRLLRLAGIDFVCKSPGVMCIQNDYRFGIAGAVRSVATRPPN
jgi:hypothetical protein